MITTKVNNRTFIIQEGLSRVLITQETPFVTFRIQIEHPDLPCTRINFLSGARINYLAFHESDPFWKSHRYSDHRVWDAQAFIREVLLDMTSQRPKPVAPQSEVDKILENVPKAFKTTEWEKR